MKKLILVFILLISSCYYVFASIAVESINFADRKIFLYADSEPYTFDVIFTPSDATDKTIKTWKVSNKNVLSMDKGTITPLAAGFSKVEAYSKDGNKVAICDVYVTDHVTCLSLSSGKKTMKVGETVSLFSYVTPKEQSSSIEWHSDNEAVVRVIKEKGSYTNIVGVSAGTANVYATVDEKQVSVSVTVEKPSVPVESINFADKKIFLYADSEPYTFDVIFTPSDATDKTIKTWKVSNKNVLSMDNGTVTPLAAGFSKVEAYSKDGNKVAICDVYVTDHVTGLSLSSGKKTMKVGETVSLFSYVTPKERSSSIEWYSDNEAVVRVIKEKGSAVNIVGVSAGTANIYAIIDGIKATCTVTVEKNPKINEIYSYAMRDAGWGYVYKSWDYKGHYLNTGQMYDYTDAYVSVTDELCVDLMDADDDADIDWKVIYNGETYNIGSDTVINDVRFSDLGCNLEVENHTSAEFHCELVATISGTDVSVPIDCEFGPINVYDYCVMCYDLDDKYKTGNVFEDFYPYDFIAENFGKEIADEAEEARQNEEYYSPGYMGNIYTWNTRISGYFHGYDFSTDYYDDLPKWIKNDPTYSEDCFYTTENALIDFDELLRDIPYGCILDPFGFCYEIIRLYD